MRDLVIVVVCGILAVVLWSGWHAFEKTHVPVDDVVCTEDAKLCPGGSYVGRQGPDCSFAPCPPAPLSYKDAVYTVDGVPHTLGESGVAYFGNDVLGDLDGDGASDAAFLFTYDGGGSGTFYYVTVALHKDGGYTGTNAVFLGDRIAPQTTEIRGREVIVNYADRKPGEPMSAQPSVGVSKHLKIENGALVAVE